MRLFSLFVSLCTALFPESYCFSVSRTNTYALLPESFSHFLCSFAKTFTLGPRRVLFDVLVWRGRNVLLERVSFFTFYCMAFLRAGVLGPPLVLPGVIACVGRRPSNWILSALSCLRPLFGVPAFYHLYFVLLRAGIFVALRNSSLLYHPYLSFGMMPCLHYRRTHRETAPYLKSLSCVYSVCTALWGAFYCLVQQTCLHTSRVPVSDNRRTAVDPRQCSTPCIPSCVGSLFDYTQSGPGQQ